MYKNVKILDCTLRDGGYVNDWNFSHSVITGTYKRLDAAGIDFIEVGFLDDRHCFDIDKSIVPTTDGLNEIFKNVKKQHAIPVAMIDFGTCSLDNIRNCGSTFIEGIRVIFKKEKIDFMICDIEMPQGSGLDLFEWVKMYYPEVECIYVSCHPEFEYIRRALQLGSADYILKPIDYEELNQILTQVVERRNKKPELEQIPEQIIHDLVKKEAQEKQDDVIHQAKHYILKHIQENIYVEEIADEVHLNAQYLMRLFRKETGFSILEYITEERIKLAKELLIQTDYPINRVADNVGYGNYSYFTKIFKKNVGQAPAAFRSERKNNMEEYK